MLLSCHPPIAEQQPRLIRDGQISLQMSMHCCGRRPVASGPGGADELAHALGQTRVQLGANMPAVAQSLPASSSGAAACTCSVHLPQFPPPSSQLGRLMHLH